MQTKFQLALLSLLTSTAACMDAEPTGDGADDSFLTADGKSDATGVTEGTAQARAVLRIANGASYATLHDVIGLYTPAVKHLIAYRSGADGTLGTADDRVIGTLAELDMIPYIGPVSFQELVDYSTSLTWTDWLPAQFSSTLRVPTPITYLMWSATNQSGPTDLISGQPRTLQVALSMTKSGAAVRIQDQLSQAQTTLDSAGAFSISYRNTGITADQRNIWLDQKTLGGKLDATGELVILQYGQLQSTGNSIYGYNGNTSRQSGAAYLGLAFVEPSAR